MKPVSVNEKIFLNVFDINRFYQCVTFTQR